MEEIFSILHSSLDFKIVNTEAIIVDIEVALGSLYAEKSFTTMTPRQTSSRSSKLLQMGSNTYPLTVMS